MNRREAITHMVKLQNRVDQSVLAATKFAAEWDLEFEVEFEDGQSTLLLVFKDGSKEDALEYFGNFFEDILSIFDQYIEEEV